jgi:hypothetical protein
MNHVRPDLDTQPADDKNSESITQHSQWNDQGHQNQPPPGAPKKHLRRHQTGDKKNPARTNTATFLRNFNRNSG